MAWTAPVTWVGNQTLTAAQLNTHLRDNLLELAPAKATTAGSYFVATGANAITERAIKSARNNGSNTTTSTSYVTLGTGPAVTVTTGTNAMIMHMGWLENNTAAAEAWQSWAISGATTRASLNDTAIMADGLAAVNAVQVADIDYMTSLTAGSNTFTVQNKVSAGTGTFKNRLIVVMPL